MVHIDHLNRPVKMTDATGASVWSAVWLPFGGAYAITGAESNTARFPGQWFQLEAGLHYNWHRHYDPSLGRYTQPDPLGFVDGPSVYGYAGNAPEIFIDPTGQYSQDPLTTKKPFDIPSGGSGWGGSAGTPWAWTRRPIPVPLPVPNPSPPNPVPELCPPGDCTEAQHRDLQNRVENACGSAKSCTAQDSVEELNAKIAAHSLCIDARRRINRTCFRGGNTTHNDQVNDRQRAIERCREFLSNFGR